MGSELASSPMLATIHRMDGVVTSYIHPVPMQGDRPAFHSATTAHATTSAAAAAQREENGQRSRSTFPPEK